MISASIQLTRLSHIFLRPGNPLCNLFSPPPPGPPKIFAVAGPSKDDQLSSQVETRIQEQWRNFLLNLTAES